MQPPHNGPCPLVGIGQFRYNHRHPGPSWYRAPPSPPPSPPSSPSGFRPTTGTGRTPPRWTPCETCPPEPSARGPVQPPASRSTRSPLDSRVSSNKTPFSTSIGPARRERSFDIPSESLREVFANASHCGIGDRTGGTARGWPDVLRLARPPPVPPRSGSGPSSPPDNRNSPPRSAGPYARPPNAL